MDKRIPFFIGTLLVFLAVWVLLTSNKFVQSLTDRLTDIGYDIQLRARILTEQHVVPLSPVAIADIDDKSLKALGRWPWSRDKIAALVDAIHKQGASVIAFDVMFSEPEENVAQRIISKLNKVSPLSSMCTTEVEKRRSYFDADTIFANTLTSKNIELGISFINQDVASNELPKPLLILSPEESAELNLIQSKGYISNIPILQKTAIGSGFINVYPDIDGIIRHAPLLMQYKNGVYPSLALQAVVIYLEEQVRLVTPTYKNTKKLESIQIGDRLIPTTDQGQVLIPFIGKSFTFKYYSAMDILSGNLPKDALSDKIVLVGTSATGLGDLKATSIENPYPGVEIQATIISGILNNNFSYVPAWTLGANVFLTILFGLIGAFSFPYFGPRILGSITILFPPTVILLNNLVWKSTGLVLALLIPVILVLILALFNIIYGYLFETRRREELKDMFGQYVPEKHIDEMLKKKSDFGIRGEDREMSVMFADIRNFTGISENMPVPKLVDMLNAFFTPMTEIIFKHKGTIDKYIGDLIMAFWGAPLKDPNHAYNVIQTALDMQRRLKHIHQEFKEHDWPEIKMGIGINSGNMAVGDMGSRFRRNYTVLGDAVNLASRLESLTKFYNVSIIASEFSQHNQPRFLFRKLDKVKVKGKQDAVTIYEVICHQSDASPDLREEVAQFHHGLDCYFKQEWDEAYNIINTLHDKNPETKIYRIYLERITAFKEHPLPDDWDGVYTHKDK